jgi:hypothetical protein
MGEMKMGTIFWLEDLKGNFHLEDPSVVGNIILE